MFNGTDSVVYFGNYANENQTSVLSVDSDSNSNFWALPVTTASWDTECFEGWDKPCAVIDSDYPYIALESSMWAQAKTDL